MTSNRAISVRRVELKYFVRSDQATQIRELLSQVMLLDPHCLGGRAYNISSVYFDNLTDTDFSDKLDGHRYREKYRLRFYENDRLNGKFEVKRKVENTIEKLSKTVGISEIDKLINADFSSLFKQSEVEYVAHKLNFKNYYPKVVVNYQRLALYLPFNQIRVTFDSHLSGTSVSEFFRGSNLEGAPVLPAGIEIMEVKFSDWLPSELKLILNGLPKARSAISKYTGARLYGGTFEHGDFPYFTE